MTTRDIAGRSVKDVRAEKRRWKKLDAQFGRELRARDQKRLKGLRAALRSAKVRRRVSVRDVRALCRSERKRLRVEGREARRLLVIEQRERRAQLREQIRRLKREQTEECGEDLARVQLVGESQIADAVRALELELEHQEDRRRLGRAGKRSSKARARAMSGRERVEHSDDEVRANLPDELRGVFEKLKSKIKPDARRSRTEVFLEYIHDHPEAVVEHMLEDERAYLEKLAAQEKELARQMKSKKRYSSGARATLEREYDFGGDEIPSAEASAGEVPF